MLPFACGHPHCRADPSVITHFIVHASVASIYVYVCTYQFQRCNTTWGYENRLSFMVIWIISGVTPRPDPRTSDRGLNVQPRRHSRFFRWTIDEHLKTSGEALLAAPRRSLDASQRLRFLAMWQLPGEATGLQAIRMFCHPSSRPFDGL